MWKNITLSLLAVIVFQFLPAKSNAEDHPFHASVTELFYNANTGNWEMSLKVFTNDLENALNRSYSTGVLNLGTEEESPKSTEWIEQYLNAKLWMTLNGEKVERSYIGREGDLDAIWIYIEFKTNGQKGTVEYVNTVLFELFENQENIVHYQRDNDKQSAWLTTRNKSVKLMD